MTSRDDFEARVKRIQQSRGIFPDPAGQTGPASDWTLPGKQKRKRSSMIGLVIAGLLSAGMICFAALYLLTSLGLTVPFAAGQRLVSDLSADPGTDAPHVVQAGFLDRLFRTGLARDAGGDPLAFLPEAPVGWLRVTVADARHPDALTQIITRWPVPDEPLGTHPAFGDLEEFIRVYDSPDSEQGVLAETRTRALYLGPEGQSLSVRLLFRGPGDALGRTSDPASWANALRAEVATATQLGDAIESFDAGGMTIFSRAAQGQSGAAHRTAVAPLDLSVALHPRAVAEIRGTARLAMAQTLLEGFDRPALSARFDQN